MQEVLGVSIFATCLFLLHERAELSLGLYNFEPVEQTTQGELRALLHRVPEGVSYGRRVVYQEALAADSRTFVPGEIDDIRRRAEAFPLKPLTSEKAATPERKSDALSSTPTRSAADMRQACRRFFFLHAHNIEHGRTRTRRA